MTPQRFRKRPVTIEAMRWDGTPEGATPIIDWVLANGPEDGPVARYVGDGEDGEPPDFLPGPFIVIVTLEGSMHATPGDWIIRGVQGEFYPCKPDIFDQTYEALPAPEPGVLWFAICGDCEPLLTMPFGDKAERDRWAIGHSAVHDSIALLTDRVEVPGD